MKEEYENWEKYRKSSTKKNTKKIQTKTKEIRNLLRGKWDWCGCTLKTKRAKHKQAKNQKESKNTQNNIYD